MSISFAVNYSRPLAEKYSQGRVAVDLFKCPAWPELIAQARELGPVYVHFPLSVGSGAGTATNSETNRPADFDVFERLMLQTGTAKLNLHFWPTSADEPCLAQTALDAATIEQVTERAIRDVAAVARRFGPERVILENLPDSPRILLAGLLPQVITRVIEETGVGFLFDLSHAILAARKLGLDEKDYMNALPVDRMQEMHITGIRQMQGPWLERLLAGVKDPEQLEYFSGRESDHLPMGDSDWLTLAWVLEQFHLGGKWMTPQIAAFEYGGIGGYLEAMLVPDVLDVQVPRLGEMIWNGSRAVGKRGEEQ